MSVYRLQAFFLVVLLALSYPTGSGAVNFPQCLVNVVNCANDHNSGDCVSTLNISTATALSLLRTSKGTPVATPDTATALSYYACTRYCGVGQEPFAWIGFSQEYSQWLLPYLALLSQLPFGSLRKTDNFMSVILTLGSPTLAAYSLYLTLFNARWVNNQLFSGIDYPSAAIRRSVVRVLSNLQQVPLRVYPGNPALEFESLIVYPSKDVWWTTFEKELDYSHTWSISSATSITWVVIAYLLTVADSLSNVQVNINSSGQGTGSVWLWLLPIVLGWLIISPKCNYTRVHEAYHKANRHVLVSNLHDPTASPLNSGLTISPSPYWKLYNKNITSNDESRIPPIFNYARALSWSQTVYVISLFYRAAWRKSSHCNDVPQENKLWNREQSSSWSREQIIQYCQPDDHEYPGVNAHWPRGVLFNMFIASLIALQLQWGTTFAAILAAWFTPTTGLGCRSLAYVIYGTLSTAVWFLLLTSSILAYYALYLSDILQTPDLESVEQRTTTTSVVRSGSGSPAIPLHQITLPNAENISTDKPASTTTTRHLHGRRVFIRLVSCAADGLQWLGKSLAVVNAIGIIANSIFQFAGVYDNCYCNSSVFFWGLSSAFNVISPSQSDIDLTKSAWIGALALGLTCCVFSVGTIYITRDKLHS